MDLRGAERVATDDGLQGRLQWAGAWLTGLMQGQAFEVLKMPKSEPTLQIRSEKLTCYTEKPEK